MVDVLANHGKPLREPFNARVTPLPGFKRETFYWLELEKLDRESAAVTALVEAQQPLWKPSDPRWEENPPYGFIRYRLKFGGRCIYCAYWIERDTWALYSKRMVSVAHVDCHADFDRPVPPGGVEPQQIRSLARR